MYYYIFWLFFFIFILIKYNRYFSSYSYISSSNKNNIYNLTCLTSSNKIFNLKFYKKTLNYSFFYNYKDYRSNIIFNLNNTNPLFMKELKNLLPEYKKTIKVYRFKNVIISNSGSVHTNSYNLRLDKGCQCRNLNVKLPKTITSYNKVLVISQYWCGEFFHAIIECFTKLSFFLSEIKRNNIFIHIGTNKAIYNYLNLLNINLNRTLAGYVKVKYGYIVENSKCGKSSGILPLFYLKNEIIKRNIYYNQLQNIILIIKRLFFRSIKNNNELIKILHNIFKNYTVEIYLPTTPFNKTLLLFGRAKYIFAPHGAGLSNIILCHKNVVIVEFLLYKKFNLCYTSLTASLGYKYYGIYQHFDGFSFILNTSYLYSYITNIIL